MTPTLLFTDLYELTMAQAYQAERLEQVAVFELVFRRMPAHRNYIVAAGFDDVRQFLAAFKFAADDLDYLRELGGFSDAFLARLEALRFSGEVYAVPEGTLVFPQEPLLQVVAPIFEAQLIETYALNQIHWQSMAATKAARVVSAARGRAVVDFGSRRAHGTDAALKIARATYLAGGAGTSNVLAGKRYGMPLFGTMAHSYVQAHEREDEAFAAFAARYPETTLLVDTYDTLAAVRSVVEMSRRLGARFRVGSIRLDSGDLGALAQASRKILDEGGLGHVKIFASSGLDEYAIQALLRRGAPIDAFGVGTKLAVIEDAPALDMVYKLVEYGGQGRFKLSSEKLIYPGRKQIFRHVEGGKMVGDVIGRWDERLPGEPLLQPLFGGAAPAPARLEQTRARFAQEWARLAEPWRRLEPAGKAYPVSVSAGLEADLAALREHMDR